MANKVSEWISKKKDAFKKARKDKLNREALSNLSEEAGPRFNLMDKIEDSPYYMKPPMANDSKSREILESLPLSKNLSQTMIPGQMVSFKYFEPKTKEELEYYDAAPICLYFNQLHTSQGLRYLGFNVHYYPPRMRYKVLSKVFEIYKPVYSKYFKDGTDRPMDAFDYQYLMKALEKAKLDFGVRMYIPELVKEARLIPPKYWEIAVFTEGWFKKRTRIAIMNYWYRWKTKHLGR